MEGHWEHLLQEARTREDTVVFTELESLVQMARFATEQVPPHREANRMKRNPPRKKNLYVFAQNKLSSTKKNKSVEISI